MNAASGPTLGSLFAEHRRHQRDAMSHKDVQALRAEVRSTAFLHWPRVAQMFGISAERARELAGKTAAQRHQ